MVGFREEENAMVEGIIKEKDGIIRMLERKVEELIC